MVQKPCFIAIVFFALSGTVNAATLTYTDRSLFEAAVGPIMVEDFESYAEGQTVPNLFGGLGTFDTSGQPLPSVFYGNWFEAGGVQGGALIPEPRFNSLSILIDFGSPQFGVGGDLFDDRDGNPFVNVLTLTITTTLNNVFSVSETDPAVNQVGFLGITSLEGIIRAEFSIDGVGGNLEVDNFTVAAEPGMSAVPVPAAVWLFGTALFGMLGFSNRRNAT